MRFTLGKVMTIRKAARIGCGITALIALVVIWLFVSRGWQGASIEWQIAEKSHSNGMNHIYAKEVRSHTGSLSAYYSEPFFRRSAIGDIITTTSWGFTFLSRGDRTLWVSVEKGTKWFAAYLAVCAFPVLLLLKWRNERVQYLSHFASLVISICICSYVIWTIYILTTYYA
jgi:hypothetical protein